MKKKKKSRNQNRWVSTQAKEISWLATPSAAPQYHSRPPRNNKQQICINRKCILFPLLALLCARLLCVRPCLLFVYCCLSVYTSLRAVCAPSYWFLLKASNTWCNNNSYMPSQNNTCRQYCHLLSYCMRIV
jgi:hypothetical protein